MKKNIYLAVLLSFFILNVKAQWTTNTLQNTLVRDSAGTSETEPLSVTTGRGYTYISWFESVNNTYQLRMQLLDSAGNKLWSPGGLIVSSFPQATWFSHYDLKVDHEDNAIVAFQDIRSGGNLNVVAYMVSSAGNQLWGTSGISFAEDAALEGLSPVICVTASDNVIIAWNSDSAGTAWVSYQKISNSGTLVWGASAKRIIDANHVYKYSRPSVVPVGTDDFMMLYVQGITMYSNVMFAQRFDVNGNAVWPNSVQVSTKTIASYYFPEVVSDLNDGLYVAFNTSNPISLTLSDVYVQHVNFSGGIWSATGTEADNSTTTHKETRSLKFIGSRFEVWVLMKLLDAGQTDAGISVQKFDTSGSVLLTSGAATVLPVSIDYDEPFEFESTGDGMIIVYTVNSGFTDKLLNAIKINYSAVTLWSPAVTPVSSLVSVKSRINLGTYHNDQVVCVWKDERLDEGVYAQNIFNNGSIGPVSVPDKISLTENFSLFPNPTTQFPVLKFIDYKTGEVNVCITDAVGKIICTQQVQVSNNALDLNELIKQNLPAGIYFVSVCDSNTHVVKKWIKE